MDAQVWLPSSRHTYAQTVTIIIHCRCCLQVCCATSMMLASATPVRKAPTVTRTQSTARQSAHVPPVTQGQPATWTLTSAPSVNHPSSFNLKSFTVIMIEIYDVSCSLNGLGANPCEHGGRCLNTKGSFQCKCLQGYEGPRCEMDVNECMSNPCHNDATCLDQIGGFHCICMPGNEHWSLLFVFNAVILNSFGNNRGKKRSNNVTNSCLFRLSRFRIWRRILPYQHGRVCQPTLSQQRQVHWQDQLLPVRVSQRWEHLRERGKCWIFLHPPFGCTIEEGYKIVDH